MVCLGTRWFDKLSGQEVCRSDACQDALQASPLLVPLLLHEISMLEGGLPCCVCVLQLQSHDYLPYCCNLLGQLPTSELHKFLRMQPSGLESGDTEEQVDLALP